MAGGDFEWKEEFNLGVKALDEEHERVFAQVRKLMAVLSINDYEESRRVCNEILAGLEGHITNHFQAEELYMIEHEYRGYQAHKKSHEDFMNVMLPACRLELEGANYSERALREFSATVLGWLTSHIIIDDKAITNRAVNKWTIDSSVDPTILLSKELAKFMKLECDLDVKLNTSDYKGTPIESGCFTEFSYDDGTEIIVGASEAIVCQMAAPLLGRPDNPFDKLTEHSYKQIAITIAKAVLITLAPEKDFSFMSSRTLDSYEFSQRYSKVEWDYSLMWDSEKGQQILCVAFPKF